VTVSSVDFVGKSMALGRTTIDVPLFQAGHGVAGTIQATQEAMEYLGTFLSMLSTNR
jgi:hypothetical protein